MPDPAANADVVVCVAVTGNGSTAAVLSVKNKSFYSRWLLSLKLSVAPPSGSTPSLCCSPLLSPSRQVAPIGDASSFPVCLRRRHAALNDEVDAQAAAELDEAASQFFSGRATYIRDWLYAATESEQ